MNTIGADQLEPNRFYWARRLPVESASVFDPDDIEVASVDSVRCDIRILDGCDDGQRRAFRSVRLRVPPQGSLPANGRGRHPNLTVISAISHRLGN